MSGNHPCGCGKPEKTERRRCRITVLIMLLNSENGMLPRSDGGYIPLDFCNDMKRRI